MDLWLIKLNRLTFVLIRLFSYQITRESFARVLWPMVFYTYFSQTVLETIRLLQADIRAAYAFDNWLCILV